MRNVVKVCLAMTLSAMMLASGAMAAQDTSKKVSKAELQRLYQAYLKEEGYKPVIDGDGDVGFKREGNNYFISVTEDDPEFFSVVLPNIWPIESDKERAQVLAAADASNAKSKVTKVFIVKDDVWVAVELFVKRPEDFKGVFDRAMSALDNGTDNFVAKMRD
ncbi:MAG TPA: hypothetical protein VGD18_00375 [Thiobacillaceae bacterium]